MGLPIESSQVGRGCQTDRPRPSRSPSLMHTAAPIQRATIADAHVNQQLGMGHSPNQGGGIRPARPAAEALRHRTKRAMGLRLAQGPTTHAAGCPLADYISDQNISFQDEIDAKPYPSWG